MVNARERLADMIRTDRGDMNVHSAPEVRVALDAYRTEVLREAADAGAKPASSPLTIYRARRVVGDRGATLGHYRTRERAQARCVTALRAERPTLVPDVIFNWVGVEGSEVLGVSTPAEPCPDVTDYVVTEITVD
ncbi:hypothetical protein [Streptomyces sp. DSM 41534]